MPERINTETLFQAASISKPVAAMGVLRAVQDGLFTLDADINTILTSWRLDGGEFTKDRPVTPRTLMSHTSGRVTASAFRATTRRFRSRPKGHKLSNVGALFMERPPMSLMEYSGGGVILMQQALSDARRRPFADIMRDDVLRPIGMAHSSFEQPLSPERGRNAARAHSREGKARGARWHVYPELAAAGKSNRVLSRTTVQEVLGRPVT